MYVYRIFFYSKQIFQGQFILSNFTTELLILENFTPDIFLQTCLPGFIFACSQF